jgi:hypothetical protein
MQARIDKPGTHRSLRLGFVAYAHAGVERPVLQLV